MRPAAELPCMKGPCMTLLPPHRLALAACLATLAFTTPPALAQSPYDAWAADGWREVQVNAKLTPNTFTFRQWDGAQAIEVQSSGSMSLMARPLEVDLQRTPVLCWRWRIDQVVETANMQRRDGDDYAARVYVSFALPASAIGFGLRTQLALGRAIWGPDLPDAALNYVWDNRHPVGTQQANAYTDRTLMTVLQTGNELAGQWVWERRHVLNDVTQWFDAGAKPVQLAVTADTDNTGAQAHAGFADFHFVAHDAQCNQAPSS